MPGRCWHCKSPFFHFNLLVSCSYLLLTDLLKILAQTLWEKNPRQLCFDKKNKWKGLYCDSSTWLKDWTCAFRQVASIRETVRFLIYCIYCAALCSANCPAGISNFASAITIFKALNIMLWQQLTWIWISHRGFSKSGCRTLTGSTGLRDVCELALTDSTCSP